MNMKKKIIQIIAVAAWLFSVMGCSKEAGMCDDFAADITIQASIGEMTKVSYNGNATSFDKGDKILVYGWTGSKTSVPEQKVVDGVSNRFNGNVWVPAKQMRWKNATDKHYFLGIYPVPDSITSFTAATYKLNDADYRASDLLVAANLGGVKATDGPVNLTFNHVLAKLNVNLKFASEWDSVPIVDKVTATVKTKATVNYLTGTMTANGVEEALAMPQSAITTAGYDYTYSCLEIPQTDAKYITITVGARKFVYEASKNIPLNSGKLTTIDLKVGKDTIFLNAISVSEWETASDLPAGVADLDPYNGHDYVDLGLSSGLKWATCNVGASAPEEYGDYFAWGETVPYYQEGYSQENYCTHWIGGKTGYNWESYKWCNGSENTLTKYCNKSEFGYNGFTDAKTTLDAYDDAASYNWGGRWRMPTRDEFAELVATKNNTDDYTWTWCDGDATKYAGTDVAGWQIVRKSTGVTLFLPIAGHRDNKKLYVYGYDGHYWSSSLDTNTPSNAYNLQLSSNKAGCTESNRFNGHSVRAVYP